jgi:hypothetical protein
VTDVPTSADDREPSFTVDDMFGAGAKTAIAEDERDQVRTERDALSGLLRREARRLVQIRKWNAYLTRIVAEWQSLWNEKEKWEKAAKEAWAEGNDLRAEVSRLSGGNTPASTQTSIAAVLSGLLDEAETEFVREFGDGPSSAHDKLRVIRQFAGDLFHEGTRSAVATPADTQAGDQRFRDELLTWATTLARGTGTVPAVDVAWKLRQLAAPSSGGAEDTEAQRDAEDWAHHATFQPKPAAPTPSGGTAPEET